MKDQQQPLNIEEAADFLDLSVSHIYKLTSTGQIPHYQPGGKRIYFLIEDLLGYIKSGRKQTADEIEAQAINYALK